MAVTGVPYEDAWRAIREHFSVLKAQIYDDYERLEEEYRDEWPLLDPFGGDAPGDDGSEVPDEVYQFEVALRECLKDIEARSPQGFTFSFAYLEWLCAQEGVVTDDIAWQSVRAALETLFLDEPVVLFAPKPDIHIPQLIVKSHYELIEMIRREPEHLFNISSREFEEIIAEVFLRRGFTVELTQATRDGGRDIVAVSRVLDMPLKCIIECKRYAPHHKVSIGVVQRLYGVKMAESANKAILATTSDFTQPARVFASQHVWDLDLKPYNDIVRWITSS